MMNFESINAFKHKIFVVEENGIELFESYVKNTAAEDILSLYCYAQDKYTIDSRDRWEAFGGLHFEIIADMRAIIPKEAWKKDTCVLFCGTPFHKDQLWQWLKDFQLPSEIMFFYDLPQQSEETQDS